MEAIAEYTGAARFEVSARGHRVVCDQPVENGGADAGMTPPEFLLASLATCAGYYAAQYLNTRKLSTEGLKVAVSAQKAQAPARLAKFRIEVRLAELDSKHEAGLLRSVKACLIHNTLAHHPEMEIELLPARVLI